ncbi:MAG: hypothetical protein Q4C60_04065 [Eubacteriales bacterium]|nr:hypothetical protein [Eubacteriales bacterium]
MKKNDNALYKLFIKENYIKDLRGDKEQKEQNIQSLNNGLVSPDWLLGIQPTPLLL